MPFETNAFILILLEHLLPLFLHFAPYIKYEKESKDFKSIGAWSNLTWSWQEETGQWSAGRRWSWQIWQNNWILPILDHLSHPRSDGGWHLVMVTLSHLATVSRATKSSLSPLPSPAPLPLVISDLEIQRILLTHITLWSPLSPR